jgi:hypothetical protein
VRPCAFAVVRLITNSKCVGCSIGMSPGELPANGVRLATDQINRKSSLAKFERVIAFKVISIVGAAAALAYVAVPLVVPKFAGMRPVQDTIADIHSGLRELKRALAKAARS